MKKIFYLMLVAVMAITMSSCNWFGNTESQTPVEDTVTYMQWQQVDSATSHINLNETSCITMTIEDSVLVFETNGIENFKVITDTAEVPILKDSNTYYIQINDISGREAKIQADSIELEF